MSRNLFLMEAGMVQYFFHCPSSRLPVRDVLNGQRQGFKTEPHIEIGAENFLKSCYQGNLKRFAMGKRQHLFLVTMCRNKELPQNGIQYVVGHIENEEVLELDDRIAISGPTTIVGFEDAIPVRNVFPWKSFTQPLLIHHPYVAGKAYRLLLEHFASKENIVEACIDEIIRLDGANETCIGTACAYNNCRRFPA